MSHKVDDIAKIVSLLDKHLFELFDRWLIEVANSSASSALTVEAYRKDLKFFFLFLRQHVGGEISIEVLKDLEPADLRAWFAAELNNSVGARSNARRLSALKSFFRFLNREIDFPLKCINSVKRPKLSKLLPHPVEFDVIEHLLNVKFFSEKDPLWVTLRDKTLYMLLYGAGLRIHEALNLTIKDVNEYLKVLGKGHKERVVPLLEKVKIFAENYIKKCPYINENDPESLLFWGVKGKVLNQKTVRQRIENFRKANNYPDYFTPHALRHSFASHLLNAGVEIRYVQELLGHSSLATTEIYTDLNDNLVFDIYKKSHPLEM